MIYLGSIMFFRREKYRLISLYESFSAFQFFPSIAEIANVWISCGEQRRCLPVSLDPVVIPGCDFAVGVPYNRFRQTKMRTQGLPGVEALYTCIRNR